MSRFSRSKEDFSFYKIQPAASAASITVPYTTDDGDISDSNDEGTATDDSDISDSDDEGTATDDVTVSDEGTETEQSYDDTGETEICFSHYDVLAASADCKLEYESKNRNQLLANMMKTVADLCKDRLKAGNLVKKLMCMV